MPIDDAFLHLLGDGLHSGPLCHDEVLRMCEAIAKMFFDVVLPTMESGFGLPEARRGVRKELKVGKRHQELRVRVRRKEGTQH